MKREKTLDKDQFFIKAVILFYIHFELFSIDK